MSGSRHQEEDKNRLEADSDAVKNLISATKAYIETLDNKIFKELPAREQIRQNIYHGPKSKGLTMQQKNKLCKKELAKFDKIKLNGYENDRKAAQKLLRTLDPEISMRKPPTNAYKIFDFKLALQRWNQNTFWQRMFGRTDNDKRTFTSAVSKVFQQHKKLGNVYEVAPSKPRSLASDEQIAAVLQRQEQTPKKPSK